MLGKLRIPDAIEPFTGWRGWNVQGGLFASPDRGDAWPDGKLAWDGTCRCSAPARAAVLIDKLDQLQDPDYYPLADMHRLAVRNELPPSEARTLSDAVIEAKRLAREAVEQILEDNVCCCGVNAYAERTDLIESGYAGRCHAIGQAAMYGSVNVFEKGYRAEQAQIARVWATRWRYGHRVRRAAQDAGIEYMGTLGAPWRYRLLALLAPATFVVSFSALLYAGSLTGLIVAAACLLVVCPLTEPVMVRQSHTSSYDLLMVFLVLTFVTASVSFYRLLGSALF
jgi:hypothetical protein